MSGYSPAQLNLAAAFDHSRLVPHDPLRAYIWYSIAARLASDQALRGEAVRGRDRLEQKIVLPRSKRHASPRDPGSQEARTPTKEWVGRDK
jgi:TPR repeat protein